MRCGFSVAALMLVIVLFSVLFFTRTRQAQYLGYALLFIAIFSMLSIALFTGVPVGAIE